MRVWSCSTAEIISFINNKTWTIEFFWFNQKILVRFPTLSSLMISYSTSFLRNLLTEYEWSPVFWAILFNIILLSRSFWSKKKSNILIYGVRPKYFSNYIPRLIFNNSFVTKHQSCQQSILRVTYIIQSIHI